MTLKLYNKKRDFKKTSEPKGKVKKVKARQLRFVVQEHSASHLHYDFRLEIAGVLKSWAVPKGPCIDPSIKRLAVHVEDHPIEYGSFEGIIPEGQYGAGSVILWDKGKWECQHDDPLDAFEHGSITFILSGKKLKGLWKLIQIKQDPKNWLLIKINDRYAKSLSDYDITMIKPRSVVSNKTIEKMKVITKDAMPKVFSPQLATLIDEPPLGENWLHEIKLDGYRIIAIIKNNKVKLLTRHNLDWTHKFKKIANEIAKRIKVDAIIDGEIVILDHEQRSNFQLLQNAINEKKNSNFIYYAFDLIYYDQQDISSLPLLDRKKKLHQIITSSSSGTIRYCDHIVGSGQKIYKKSCELGLEGIISKKIDSPYIQKRTKNWLKIKCIKRQEFIVVGYTKPKATRKYFGSLLLAIYDKNNKLRYCGNVGTGYTQKSLREVYQLLAKYRVTESPLQQRLPGLKNITWIKPTLVVEVEFIEWTSDGLLRHPSFKGIRIDKSTKEIRKEKETPIKKLLNNKKTINQDSLSYNLSHSDKILYPEQKITKLEVAEYYNFINDWIMPYISNRPLTLVRCPNNYKTCFYQKHYNQTMPDSLHKIQIRENNIKEKDIYVSDKEGLMALPQLDVLELHPWGSKVDNLEKPDIIVFDLDPAPEIPWKKVVKAAFEIKSYLKKIKLISFVKSTGGKGLHIVIPIQPESEWDDVKLFSRTFVEFLVMNHPNEYIGKMNKVMRKGKIYIDYLRNQRGATAIAPYSTRARDNATIATPIAWNELTDNILDTTFTLRTIYKRMAKLKKDPWKDFFKIKQSLNLKSLKGTK